MVRPYNNASVIKVKRQVKCNISIEPEGQAVGRDDHLIEVRQTTSEFFPFDVFFP